jgi:hypothetical protein
MARTSLAILAVSRWGGDHPSTDRTEAEDTTHWCQRPESESSGKCVQPGLTPVQVRWSAEGRAVESTGGARVSNPLPRRVPTGNQCGERRPKCLRPPYPVCTRLPAGIIQTGGDLPRVAPLDVE